MEGVPRKGVPRVYPEFSKGDLKAEIKQYVDRVPSIKMPPPRLEATCRIAPILLEPAHLKEAMQQQLTTEERGLVDGDARANSGHRVTLEVLRFVDEEPHEEDPEEVEKDIGGQPSTLSQPAFVPPTASGI